MRRFSTSHEIGSIVVRHAYIILIMYGVLTLSLAARLLLYSSPNNPPARTVHTAPTVCPPGLRGVYIYPSTKAICLHWPPVPAPVSTRPRGPLF